MAEYNKKVLKEFNFIYYSIFDKKYRKDVLQKKELISGLTPDSMKYLVLLHKNTNNFKQYNRDMFIGFIKNSSYYIIKDFNELMKSIDGIKYDDSHPINKLDYNIKCLILIKSQEIHPNKMTLPILKNMIQEIENRFSEMLNSYKTFLNLGYFNHEPDIVNSSKKYIANSLSMIEGYRKIITAL